MAITVSKPISAPTNLNATLVSGGELEPNTTYYFVVIAYLDNYITPVNSSYFGYHSDLSAEGTFTTTTTELSAHITWTNPPEHTSSTRYDIFLTKVSSNYEGKPSYNVDSFDRMNNIITDGTDGYTVTNEGTDTYLIHTAQSTNDFVGEIDKSLGIIKVSIHGGYYNNYAKQLYDEIVSQGYGDYVNYDGNRFILKGWIVSEGTDSGYLIFYYNDFIFIRGGVHSDNPNYYIQFGAWTNDLIGASYVNGCNIDIINSRSAFRGLASGLLRVYGSHITTANNTITTNLEPLSTHNLLNGSNLSLGYSVSEIKDTICETKFRNYGSSISDIKAYFLNNFGNYPHYRVDIASRVKMPYSGGGKFYECKFLDDTFIGNYQPSNGNTFYTDMYNCEFPNDINNKPLEYEWLVYAPLTVANNYIQYNFSLTIEVKDDNGNPAEGVNVNITDKDGNPATWIEYEDTTNKDVTGNEYTTDRVTDETGKIKYYLESYTATHDPDDPASGVTNDKMYGTVITDKYPYTVTISKNNASSEIIIKDFLSPTKLFVVLTNKPNFRIVTF